MRHLATVALAGLLTTFASVPAHAGRTVIDLGTNFTTSGYCSYAAASFTPGDCNPKPLGFDLKVGNQVYNSFYLNSNGVLSLDSIKQHLLDNVTFTSLGSFTAPVFSPYFLDGAGFGPFADGAFAAQVVTSNSDTLKLAWYRCLDPANCGLQTVQRGLGFAPSFYLTLTNLAEGGFLVNYDYDSGVAGTVGTSGFNLPGVGLSEVRGPLQNRSFGFNAEGQLGAAVPEPATWLSMLLGFVAIGTAVRRRSRAQQPAVVTA
jgi:hypothetical protein